MFITVLKTIVQHYARSQQYTYKYHRKQTVKSQHSEYFQSLIRQAWLHEAKAVKVTKTLNIFCRWISTPSDACFPSTSARACPWTTKMEVRPFPFLQHCITKRFCNNNCVFHYVLRINTIPVAKLTYTTYCTHDLLIKTLITFFYCSIPSITEGCAKDAFIQFASSKCCYSSGPAKDGVITHMEPFNTYRVRRALFTSVCVSENKNRNISLNGSFRSSEHGDPKRI